MASVVTPTARILPRSISSLPSQPKRACLPSSRPDRLSMATLPWSPKVKENEDSDCSSGIVYPSLPTLAAIADSMSTSQPPISAAWMRSAQPPRARPHPAESAAKGAPPPPSTPEGAETKPNDMEVAESNKTAKFPVIVEQKPPAAVSRKESGGLRRKKKKKGVARACKSCRSSHTACGPERPCRRCVERGRIAVEQCIAESLSSSVDTHRGKSWVGADGSEMQQVTPILHGVASVQSPLYSTSEGVPPPLLSRHSSPNNALRRSPASVAPPRRAFSAIDPIYRSGVVVGRKRLRKETNEEPLPAKKRRAGENGASDWAHRLQSETHHLRASNSYLSAIARRAMQDVQQLRAQLDAQQRMASANDFGAPTSGEGDANVSTD